MTKMYEEIVSELNERGYKTETKMISKNGILKTAVLIGEGNVRATIYPEVKTDVSVTDIVDDIIKQYNDCKMPDSTFLKNVTSWDYAKEHLQLCIQRKTTENILKWDFLDLEMYVRVTIKEEGDENTSSYIVGPDFFPNIGEEEIFDRAFRSLKESAYADDLISVLANRVGLSSDQIRKLNLTPSVPMIVVSNRTGYYGASAICDTEILDSIAEQYNCNLVIMPSSIHECIAIPTGSLDINADESTGIVQMANTTYVRPEEVLSDHSYFYNKETHEITW